MATISVSLPADGQTADAADYNVPINTIVAEINGGLDSANIEAGGVVPNSLLSGTGTSWAWQSWTPTLSGRLNDSKWTKTCTYIQVGKTVFFKLILVANTTTPMDGGSANAIFTLPVTSISYGGTAGTLPIGKANYLDAGTAVFAGYPVWASTTTARLAIWLANATYVTQDAITSTTPFTWTTSDEIQVLGSYEAA